MHHIRRSFATLLVCAAAVHRTGLAQDSVPDLPAGLVVTTGVESDPARSPAHDSVVVLPNPSCPLTDNELAAVRTGVAAGFIGVNAYLYHYFKQAWWSGTRSDHFFFHADWDQWFRDQDKFGHMFGGFHLTRVGYAGLREACVSQKKAIFWAAAYAAAFQLQIEIFDGHFEKYGFSYADMIANTTGQALAVMQELHPSWKVVKPTFSYHKTQALLNTENGTIGGCAAAHTASCGELRPSLDYAGQTYWFSTDVEAVLPTAAKEYWPSFIRFSVGHSITDWIDPTTGLAIRAKRKIILSLDFDPDKLPGDWPLWRTVKRTLSYYRFPAPALELTPKLKFDKWYR